MIMINYEYSLSIQLSAITGYEALAKTITCDSDSPLSTIFKHKRQSRHFTTGDEPPAQ